MPTRPRSSGALAALSLLVLALVVVACGAGGTAPATAPAPTATATAPVTASPATASPGTLPSEVIPTPVGGEPVGSGVTVTAQNIAFQPTEVSIPADEPATIVLRNADDGVPHGLLVNAPSGEIIAQSEIVSGPGEVRLALPPLEAGSYAFLCPVHPNMTGTLVVGP